MRLSFALNRAHVSKKMQFDKRATAIARCLTSKLRMKYGVDFPIREPRVYSLSSSRLAELLKFILLDFLLWPLAARRREPPFLGAYDINSFLLGEVPIILTLRSMDITTLEHEVRHHFCYELKRCAYTKSSALDFLREYYWDERHCAIAEKKLRALRRDREIPRKMSEERYREVLLLLESLSKGEFIESRYLPDAVAGIITEASLWVSEGFAAEKSLADIARVPLKLILGTATLVLVYISIPLLFSTSLPYSLSLAYLIGGIVNISYGFLRTLPLDIGMLRWRRLRARIKDEDIPRVLAFPPKSNKTAEDILMKLEEYPVF